MTGDVEHTILIGVYTLTPTHCGTGQVSGAVDLPVAREAATGLPVLPASSVKGVLRASLEERLDENDAQLLGVFGRGLARTLKEAEKPDREGVDELQAGNVVFTEGAILLLAVRSLRGVFKQVTCPIALRRVARAAGALGLTLPEDFMLEGPAEGEALVATGENGPISLEDLFYPADRVRGNEAVTNLATALAPLISSEAGEPERLGLSKRLVVVSDDDFVDLARRAVPVQARIVLGDNKTSENLWYEETLPADCLFAVLCGRRLGANASAIADFRTVVKRAKYDERWIEQIGGNETLGQGICRWTFGVHATGSSR